MNLLYETERLVLRVLDGSNAESVLDYYVRNKEFLSSWEAKRFDAFYTVASQENILNDDKKNISRGNLLRLWIFKKSDSLPQRVIGTVAFSSIIRGAFFSCFLGYKLDKDEINNGYITEAIKKGIDIMYNEHKLHRIEANIMPGNKASMRVVEKLGFYNEGLAYKYLKVNGIWENHIHMVLLNEDME